MLWSDPRNVRVEKRVERLLLAEAIDSGNEEAEEVQEAEEAEEAEEGTELPSPHHSNIHHAKKKSYRRYAPQGSSLQSRFSLFLPSFSPSSIFFSFSVSVNLSETTTRNPSSFNKQNTYLTSASSSGWVLVILFFILLLILFLSKKQVPLIPRSDIHINSTPESRRKAENSTKSFLLSSIFFLLCATTIYQYLTHYLCLNDITEKRTKLKERREMCQTLGLCCLLPCPLLASNLPERCFFFNIFICVIKNIS